MIISREHVEISRVGGWIDSVPAELIGFSQTPLVGTFGLEKREIILYDEPLDWCTMT